MTEENKKSIIVGGVRFISEEEALKLEERSYHAGYTNGFIGKHQSFSQYKFYEELQAWVVRRRLQVSSKRKKEKVSLKEAN